MSTAMSDVLYYIDAPAESIAPREFDLPERQVLQRVNQKVAAAESLSSLVDFLFHATARICPCDRLGLAFLEEDAGRVVAHDTRAAYEPVLLGEGYAEDLAGSSLEAILEHGRLRIINDLEAYLGQKPNSRSTRLLVREGVRSSMTCPLRVDGRIVGLLFRSSRRPRAYCPHTARMHLAVAERLSQAVEKAWRIEQLTAANRAYMEMLGFVSHELKNPVASIVTDAQLLAEGYLGELGQPVCDKLAGMQRKGEHLLALIRDYLELARLEGGRLRRNDRSGLDLVTDLLDPALELVQSQMEAKQISLQRRIPPDLPPARFDPDLLQIVMVNLLGNAIKYGVQGGTLRLGAGVAEEGGWNLSVWNEGPGFPDDQRPRLFRKFSRLQTPELQKRRGTGVGLYTCWRIVKLHGGTIRAASEPGQWAEFTFTIPQPLPALEQNDNKDTDHDDDPSTPSRD